MTWWLIPKHLNSSFKTQRELKYKAFLAVLRTKQWLAAAAADAAGTSKQHCSTCYLSHPHVAELNTHIVFQFWFTNISNTDKLSNNQH